MSYVAIQFGLAIAIAIYIAIYFLGQCKTCAMNRFIITTLLVVGASVNLISVLNLEDESLSFRTGARPRIVIEL